MSWWRLAPRIGLALVALLLLIQLIPYGRGHSNPPVTQAARWTDPQAEQLATQSCYDCHSNLTKWSWYSNIAPVSWLVQSDVDEGRDVFNFSEWDKGAPDLGEMVEQVSDGSMPPRKYTLPHPSASLSSSDKQILIRGLESLYRSDPPPIRSGG